MRGGLERARAKFLRDKQGRVAFLGGSKDFKGLHPAPFGHALYAKSIGWLFDATWSPEKDASVSADRVTTSSSRVLPAPLDPSAYFVGRLEPIDRAKPESGWTRVERWKPEDGVAARAGFQDVPALVASQPGSLLRLKFTGNAAGIFVTSGPDTGVIEWQVDGGAWQKLDLYTRWSERLHLPWAQVLASGLRDGPHEMVLRIGAEKNPQSKGHAVRIQHFLVNAPSS